MCGVVGYIGRQNALPIIVEGLRRLEYRGYDSSGVALLRQGKLAVFKKQGKLDALLSLLPTRAASKVGIGHTRWASHGEPSDENAHPHLSADRSIAVIHNGIVENAKTLRAQLQSQGTTFTSSTDTEVLAHLIAAQPGNALVDRVRAALTQVTGAYGLAVMDQNAPDELVVARLGSPMVLGIGDKEMFAASDVSALVRHTQQVVYLEDGEIARLSADGFEVTTLDAQVATKETVAVNADLEQFDKEHYAHFTLKEIHEQADVVRRVLSGRLDERFSTARLDGLNLTAKDCLAVRRIKILGCGSALIAGSIGARTIEAMARIPCDAESAAEFRYRNPIIEQDTLYFAVSQSGETYDTLAAVEEIKRKGGTVLGVINTVGSSIARACDGGMYLHAGNEVAVVSTKTFTATLTAFAMIGLYFARGRDMAHSAGAEIIQGLRELPDQLQQLCDDGASYKEVAASLAKFDHAYFIGRNEGYFLAMEGALKLKEISYIHAEAYAASELKHGPLALIDEVTPTVALVPDDDLLVKNETTIAEIRARKGPVWVIAQAAYQSELPTLRVPSCHPLLTPILLTVPLQLLAYHAALARGCDVDRPRNLAKSVTVE